MTQDNAPSPLTKALVDAFIASATLWLARLLALLLNPRAAHRKRLFRRLVQCAERWVEHVLFIAAAQRLGTVLGTRRRAACYVIPRAGFRVAVGSNRLLWKSARIKLKSRDLVARVAHLLAALLDPARPIAHYMKRLARGLCFRRLIAIAPPACAIATLAYRDATAADTS